MTSKHKCSRKNLQRNSLIFSKRLERLLVNVLNGDRQRSSGRENDFQKADDPGEDSFATPQDAGFPRDPLSEKSHTFAE
jgi:hypothetical protein